MIGIGIVGLLIIAAYYFYQKGKGGSNLDPWSQNIIKQANDKAAAEAQKLADQQAAAQTKINEQAAADQKKENEKKLVGALFLGGTNNIYNNVKKWF